MCPPRALSAVVVMFVAASCASPPGTPSATTRPAATGAGAIRHEFTHRALGTRFRIVVYCPDRPAAGRAEAAVFRRLAELEEVFDETRPTSELSQLYANADIGTVRASDDLFRLLRELEKFGGRTKGSFDVTAGASAEMWRRSVESGTLPTPDEITQARALAGAEKLRFDAIGRTVQLTAPGVRLDLGSVIPAFACDRVLAALRSAGFPGALVEAGAQIAVGDAPPGRDAWLIRVNNAPPKAGHRTLHLKRQAVVSTGPVGDTVNLGGIAYARLLDPRTGLGARNTAPATVVARRAWQADALARAAAVAGERDTRLLVRAVPEAKVWIHDRAAGTPSTAKR